MLLALPALYGYYITILHHYNALLDDTCLQAATNLGVFATVCYRVLRPKSRFADVGPAVRR